MGRHLELWFHTCAMLQSFENFLLFPLCHTTIFFWVLIPRVMTYLNDKHKGWNNQDTIWCFHWEPKFQSSLSSPASETSPRQQSPHIHSYPSPFQKSSRSLHRNPHLTQDKSSPCLFAPMFPFSCKCSTRRPRFHPLLCKLHNFSQWNVHQAYRNKTLQ